MSDSLAVAVTAYALSLAVVAATTLAVGRRPGPALTAGAVVLALALALQALLAVGDLVSGYRPPDPAIAIGYLIASVVILPATIPAAADEPSRWAAAMLALASLATAVVALRLLAVWTG